MTGTGNPSLDWLGSTLPSITPVRISERKKKTAFFQTQDRFIPSIYHLLRREQQMINIFDINKLDGDFIELLRTCRSGAEVCGGCGNLR